METEARNSLEKRLAGLIMPNPPRRAGREKSSCTGSLGGALPVQAGSRLVLMISSMGCSRGSLIGVVLERNVNLWTKPWIKASKVTCD